MCTRACVCVCVCVFACACTRSHVWTHIHVEGLQAHMPNCYSGSPWEMRSECLEGGPLAFTFTLSTVPGWPHTPIVNNNNNLNSKFSHLHFNSVNNFASYCPISMAGCNLGRAESLVSQRIFRAAIMYAMPQYFSTNPCVTFPNRCASPSRTQARFCFPQTHWEIVLDGVSSVTGNS